MLNEITSQSLEVIVRVTLALLCILLTLRASLVLFGIHLIKETQRGNKAAALFAAGLMLSIGLVAAFLK